MAQDVQSIVTTLPSLASSISVVVVRRRFSTGSHKDFRVKREKVWRALSWLKKNNRYYTNIEIDVNTVASLPEDGA